MKQAKTMACVLLLAVLSLLFLSCSAQTPPGETESTALPASESATEKVTEPSAAESTPAEQTVPAETETSEAEVPADIYETGLPVLEILIDESKGTIEAMNNDPEHETKCFGEMRIDIPAGYQSEYGDKAYEEAVSETYPLEYIRGRGNSTWGRDKKPYRIKLDKKADLLGMGEEKNWALLANYYDCTMLRNKLTYKLGEEFFPEGTFVPQSVYVHVLMNGEYLGLYCLSENVRLGKERVPIEEPSYEEDATDEEISGGYLVTMEIMDDGGAVFRTDRNQFQIDTPELGDITDRQLAYITDYVQRVEDSICDPDRVEIPADLMDLDAYIDYFLIQEASRNGDGYRSSSTYFYKGQGGKLVFGPLWDFDYVAWSGSLTDPEGFENVEYAPWMNRLLQDGAFRYRLSWRWGLLKRLLETMVEDGGWIDTYVAEIKDAQVFNYQVASTFLWEEPALPGDAGTEDGERTEPLTAEEIEARKQIYGFEQEVERLRSWIRQRTEWLDAHIQEIRSEKTHLEFMDEKEMVRYQVLTAGEELNEDLVPVPEKKAGYRFAGWYREEQGGKIPLAMDDPARLGLDTIVYQAEWEPYDPAEDLKGLAFSEEVYYVDSLAYLDLTSLVSAAPFDFDKEYLTMTAKCEPEDCAYPSDLFVAFSGEGEVRVTLSCGDKKASCRIIAVKEDKLVLPKDYSLPEKMTLKAGTYGFLNLKPEDGAMTIAKRDYEKPEYTVEDSQIAEIDANGYVHAMKEGTTTITVTDQDTGKTWNTVLTVEK